MVTFINMQNGPCCYEPELYTGARACTKKHESISFTSDQKACEMRLGCGSGSVSLVSFPAETPGNYIELQLNRRDTPTSRIRK